MKKLFQIGAVLCGLLMTSSGFAQSYDNNNGCCDDQPAGQCYCLYVHYEPCYYTTRRCVEEKIPCKKTCCQYVDQYYEVQRCRYVPQYYTETLCQKVPQYYEVDDCKTCYKWVCDQHCTYKPRYYWKHSCQPANPTCPAGYTVQGDAGCASGGCCR